MQGPNKIKQARSLKVHTRVERGQRSNEFTKSNKPQGRHPPLIGSQAHDTAGPTKPSRPCCVVIFNVGPYST